MSKVEWPTVILVLFCYGLWGVGTVWFVQYAPILGVVITGFSIALHASIQHEIIHGHPTRSRVINEALVFPALSLFVPYGRFRDTHIAHHTDERLTDPYDDPESNFLDRGQWERFRRPVRALYDFNNTLLGRLLIGVVISQIAFVRSDWKLVKSGDMAVIRSWLCHIPSVALVIMWVLWVEMTVIQYLIAAYIGNALVKIRTFAEHRAHEAVNARSVVIEDTGLLAFLFLNNNFHAVHHDKPGLAWYRLPGYYFARRDEYLEKNQGYRFPTYWALFRNYLFQKKDQVAHPLWRRG